MTDPDQADPPPADVPPAPGEAEAPEPIAMDGACCLLYRDAPAWQGLRTAAIGRFRCLSVEAGRAMLEAIAAELAAAGFAALIGPMDGDTWHSYRLIAESDGSRPFLMEPVSGPHDHAAFLAAGFQPISHYVSTRTDLDAAIGPAEVSVPGIAVTAWDGGEREHLVAQLFALSAAAFRNNALFKPIAREAFLTLYEPVLPFIDPRLVLFARDGDGTLVGFLLGLADRLEGPYPQSVILKTYASLRRGVGHLLADQFHRRARRLGYSLAIHALMHVDNVSLQRSGRHGATMFRRYALMGRRL